MRKIRMLPLLLSVILLSGCWDKVEIDRNVFISAIGIDVGKDIKKEEQLKKIGPDEPFGERAMERLNITYAFPDVSEYTAQKGALPKDKFLKIEAYSLEDAQSNATLKSSRNVNINHAKLLAISSDIFTYPDVLKEVVDYISRQPRVNKTMNVIIVNGRVEEFLKGDLKIEKNMQNYIEGLMENSSRQSSILPITLTELLVLLSQNGNAILPNFKLDKSKNELSVTGVSVIKDYAIKGSLTPQETSVLEMVRGKLRGGKKVIYEQGHPIDMEIDGLDRDIKVDSQGDKLIFKISLDVEGKIKGYQLNKEILQSDTLDTIEKNFSNSIAEECVNVIRLTQQEFSVDPFGLREYIEKYHPFLWDKIKDKWENYYKDAEIAVDVKTNIRRVGVIK